MIVKGGRLERGDYNCQPGLLDDGHLRPRALNHGIVDVVDHKPVRPINADGLFGAVVEIVLWHLRNPP
jgi:hypothetical protein